MARCTSAVLQLGYGIKGCGGIDILRPDRAVAVYQLAPRGGAVVTIDGQTAQTHYRKTYAEAEKLFWVLRSMVRGLPV